MNLNQLRYFIAVCENGSVLAAAEKLHISQPSLSASVKQLEEEFGVSLFRRQHKGMVLTESGEEFYKLAEELIKHSEQVQGRMLELGKGRNILRLGVPPMIGSVLLPEIYSKFVANNSDVQLQITEAGRLELTRQLDGNRLDMVLLPHDEPFEKEYKALGVAKFEIVCCANRNKSVSKLSSISAKQLVDEDIILFKNSFFQTAKIKNRFEEAGVEPKILMQTDQLSTLLNLTASGRAVGFMFRQLIAENHDLTAVPFNPPMEIGVSLVWKASSDAFAARTRFIEFMKSLVIE